MDKKTIRDIEVTGKTVLVRVDFNVPRDKETGEITNDNRIVAALPTLKYLLEQKPKAVVLFSHLGKVKTEVMERMVSKKKYINTVTEVLPKYGF